MPWELAHFRMVRLHPFGAEPGPKLGKGRREKGQRAAGFFPGTSQSARSPQVDSDDSPSARGPRIASLAPAGEQMETRHKGERRGGDGQTTIFPEKATFTYGERSLFCSRFFPLSAASQGRREGTHWESVARKFQVPDGRGDPQCGCLARERAAAALVRVAWRRAPRASEAAHRLEARERVSRIGRTSAAVCLPYYWRPLFHGRAA